MAEIFVGFAEVVAAIAIMVVFTAIMNNKNNNDEHTMEPVRIPVKSNRKNRD